MSESDFLASEGADAKEAIRQSLDELKASLGQATDFRLWTKKHPWAAVGVAAAAGFVAATAITPRTDQSVQDKLSELNEAIHSTRAAAPPRETTRAPGTPTFYQSLLASIFDLAKIAIENFILAAVQSRQVTQPAAEESHAAASPTSDQASAASA